MGLHKDVGETNMHEPKGMTTLTAGATDIGKVVVSKGDGKTETRLLSSDDLSDAAEGDAYGEMVVIQNTAVQAIPAAIDSTLYTVSDYVKLVTSLETGITAGVTYANNELTAPITGTYILHAWTSVKSSVSNTVVAMKVAIDGAPSAAGAAPTSQRKIATSGDIGVVAGSLLISLIAGQKVSIYVATNNATDLTFTDASVSILLVAAS